jgi:uncharacterized membrane protein YphA (DoxX/SURF4 family)
LSLLAVHSAWGIATGPVSVFTSVLVLVGLWTPYAAATLGVAQLSLVFFGGFPVETHLCRAAIAIALVMLGPGAWSIDRRLFGRKRIDLSGKPRGA